MEYISSKIKDTIGLLENIREASTDLFLAEWGKLEIERPPDEEPLWQALHDALVEYEKENNQ